MNRLQHIWDDIKKGENLDLYLTVVAAVVIATLNLFGVAQAYIAPLTLAVLALLALAMLGNRYQHQQLVSSLSQNIESVFLTEFPASVRTDFETGQDLWMVGISLSTPIDDYYSTLEKKLRLGHKVKVLMVRPDSPAVEMSEMRAYARANAARTRIEIQDHLQDFCKLREIAPDSILIRTIAHPLGHGVLAMNPDSTSGVLYISNYPYKTEGGSLPKMVLRPKDGIWYELYRQELHNLWDSGEDWLCSESSQ